MPGGKGATRWWPMAVTLVCLGWWLVPVVPHMVKAWIPFPALEEARLLEGRFAYEGEWPRQRVPRYFVVDSKGRHEFQCGYLGQRHTCFDRPSAFAGQPIRVWSSYAFGALQVEVLPIPGVRPHPMDTPLIYERAVAAHAHPDYPAWRVRWLPVVLLLMVLLALLVSAWARRNAPEAP